MPWYRWMSAEVRPVSRPMVWLMKGDSFGFCLAHGFGGGGAALGSVKHLVRELMHQGVELFGWFLSGQDRDACAVARAQRGGDEILQFKPDPLRGEEVDQPSPVLARSSGDLGRKRWKVCALRLAHIEDVGRTEPTRTGLCVDGGVLALFGVFAGAGAHERGEDADAFFALLHLAAQLVPRIQAGYAGGIGPLPCDRGCSRSCSGETGPWR